MKTKILCLMFGFLMGIVLVSCKQGQQGGKEGMAGATYKMTTAIPEGIQVPDRVSSRLGTLKFFDGIPDKETVRKVYDNLDFQRGVDAFLAAMPAAVLHGLHIGVETLGPVNQTALITESLMDSRTLIFGANTETVYTFIWLDTKHGPLVIDLPPHVLGMINDSWGRYVADMGNAGPDKGQGGKFLLLPPGYTGVVPDGFFVMRSPTFGNWMFFRSFLEDGGLRAAVANTKEHFRVYLLDHMANPPAMNFVNISGMYFNTIPATDASYFEHVAAVVREEPTDAIDPETAGLLASIGIRKDKSFAPDARMRGLLAEAAAVGNATARAILFSTRDSAAYYYPNSAWQMCWIGGYDFMSDGVLNLDARTLLFYLAWGVSPTMTVKMVGRGSQYATAFRDAAGRSLNGSKTYRLHLPPNIPAKDFWSVVVYDPQTRCLLQTDQPSPSTSSQKEGISINPDKSVDVYFGPEPPAGKKANWIQTIPGKAWYAALRLYGPGQSWFDKTWRPGEIELVRW